SGAFGNDNPVMRTCLARAHVPVLAFGDVPYDDASIAEAHGYYLQLFAPTWNRFAPALVKGLAAQGYFSGWDTATSRVATGAAQLVGALGIGVDPDIDVARAYQQPRLTPAAGSCRSIMLRAGLDYRAKQFADAYSLLYCEAFRLLSLGVQLGGGLTPAQILSG